MASAQTEEAVVLHVVKGFGDIDTTGVKLYGELSHENAEVLVTCRIGGVVKEETDDALTEGLRGASPREVGTALRLGGQEVEQVETEDEEVVEQAQHLILGEGDEMGLCEGLTGGGKLWMGTEEGFGLEEPGGVEFLGDGIAVVIAAGSQRKLSADEEEQLLTGVTFTDHGLAGLHFQESELRVTSHLLQFRRAEALEQRELQ